MGAETNFPARNQIETVVALYNRGELDAALTAVTNLLREFPSAALLHNIRGAIHARKGDQENAAADFRNAISADPNMPDAYNNLGVALRSLKRQTEALAHYARALQLRQDYLDAHFNMANALFDLDRRAEAAAKYQDVLRLAPNHLGARNNFGLLLNKLERHEEAIAQFRAVLTAKPDFVEAYNNIGLAYKFVGGEEEALESFAQAIRLKPDYARAHYNLASYLVDLGRKEEAAKSYAKALQADPNFAEAYRSLSALKRYEEGDPQIAHMLALLRREGATDDDRMHLNYALGKASEDIGRRDEAFHYYAAANSLRRKFLRYDPEVERRTFRTIKEAFEDIERLKDLYRPPAGELRQTPVFIVGMPRSGTSLTEHILASHSQIYGAGELMTLGKAINSVWDGSTLTAEHFKAVRELYLAGMKRHNADEPYITDKMHMNYRWIGFIRLALPEAKIVHTKRRSMASCWSIFKYYFSDFGNGYAYDLDDLGEYYSSYMDMMQFWNDRFPGDIHNFSYERLTEHQEEETRKILNYLGLELERSCIDFHETRRAVATISSMQVRKKLYKGSSDEWRKYEKFLRPLLERFGED